MKQILSLCLVIVCISLFHITAARQKARTISGIVVAAEDNHPLEGVAILAKGTKNISGTQPDGIYYISISEADSILIFELKGYVSQELKVEKSNEYNILLRPVN
jgi:hypothetical protein